ncbi:MarR family winged helix-turn-helix transcriptional regulator [Demequina sp.]|uniref:MarR family winged helix-turn-helix transcriptional regulator n=1 Tax=Demequina sp. TaxID=2050685 RepID=UPI003D0D66EF
METVATTEQERILWARYNALLTTVPGMIDERMRAATGLSRFQFMLLDTLAKNPTGQVQLADVARAADSSLSRLSHAITRLEEAGLVERRACDSDRRASWAVLTPAGAKAMADAREAHDAVMREVLLSRIPAGKQAEAIAFLTALLPDDVAGACSTIDGV